jgi:beta-glucosidase-like glycosyl hydrolase
VTSVPCWPWPAAAAAATTQLPAGLQAAARRQHPAIPLLIGTDQEGGIVSRLAGLRY